MGKRETIIQNKIRVALSKYGIPIRMNSGLFYTSYGKKVRCGIPGMSDILFIGQGFVAWIEVKTDTGNPSAEQLRFIDCMKELGHKAGIVRSVDEALKLIGVM